MTNTSRTLRVGQKVWYMTWTDECLPAVIKGFGEKNGQVVVSLSDHRWGYLDQIEPRE